MVTDENDGDRPGSPPALCYPPSPELVSQSSRSVPALTTAKDDRTPDYAPHGDKHPSPYKFPTTGKFQRHLRRIKTLCVKRKTRWDNHNILEEMGELGVLQWWYKVNTVIDDPLGADWKIWKDMIIDYLRQKFKSLKTSDLQEMFEDTETYDRPPPQCWEHLMELSAIHPTTEQFQRHIQLLKNYHLCFKDVTWRDDFVFVILGDLGMLQWWWWIHTIPGPRRPRPEWNDWKDRIFKRWSYCLPGISQEDFKNALESPETQGTQEKEMRELPNKKKQDKDAEDVEMDNEDAPQVPAPTPDPVWIPSSPPQAYKDAVDKAVKAAKFDPEEFQALQTKVEELDERFETATKDLRQRLTRLGDQVYEDGVTLMDLKWWMAAIADIDEKSKNPGKRMYRKANAKPLSHRYATRLAASMDDEVLEISRKEYGNIERKTNKLEKQIEETKQETDCLKAKLIQAEALTPKIEALAKSLDEFRATQLRVNLGHLQEFTHLRDFYGQSIVPRFDAQSREIAGLQSHFSTLWGIVAKYLGFSHVTTPYPTKKMTIVTHSPAHAATSHVHQHKFPTIRTVAAL